MKLIAATVLLLLAPLSVSAPSPSFLGSQSPIKPDTVGPPVNGDNPLVFCANPSDYILTIDTVDLSPNPPEPGRTLTIKASGFLSKSIKEGAKVLLTVKYGLITILNGEVDLCDQLKEVDLSCPLQKGDLSLTKSVELPQHIPPGKYTVHADVYTKSGDRITCLEANNIEFK